MELLNIAGIKRCTEAEGPFRRMAVWFQGCPIKCFGCTNPELIGFEKANLIEVSALLDIAISARDEYGIEGVTFLGGEPTAQKNLLVLSRSLRDHGFGIILFSGYTMEYIDPALLETVDLLVDGPFIQSLMDTNRNMIGSSNQRIIVLTDRYRSNVDWFNVKRNKRVEVVFDGNDLIFTGDVIKK